VTPRATLYVGVAVPLVEVFHLWIAKVPRHDDPQEQQQALKSFPHREIGAYALRPAGDPSSGTVPAALAFRTAATVSPERVRERIEAWSAEPPELVASDSTPIAPLDHRRYLDELQRALEDKPVRVVPRIGLTLQHLQRDRLALRPEMVALFCHGTDEGCLLLEDGRGTAAVTPGDRVLGVLTPRPRVTVLAACYSEAVLKRAAEDGGPDAAIVSVDSESAIEVTATAEFQSLFYDLLLQGRTVGEAFDAAQSFVANSDVTGDLAFARTAPSQKLRINPAGRDVRLDAAPATAAELPPELVTTPHARSPRIRRGLDHFVGRRPELAEVLDALLPLPAGVRRPGAGVRRLVTLTKEGGIGKTALAAQASQWATERGLFPGGVVEISCEEIPGPGQLLSRLLATFGVPAESQRGDLLELLAGVLGALSPRQGRVLLVLDNLDDLVGNQMPLETNRETQAVLETAVAAAPELRMLATCRWPLGMAEEAVVAVKPLTDGDSRDVFMSYVESPQHVLEAHQTWPQDDSPVRQLIRLSGRHPQSLRLLARQLGRHGMTIAKLRDEAYADLLPVLTDPYRREDDDDRQLKVERSYELSYRHLSAEGQVLFARLARLPGGVWCGEMPENVIGWQELLGEQWKAVLEKELDYYALVHFEADPSGRTEGFFRMLPAMVELSRRKLEEREDEEWTGRWVEFWRRRLSLWNQMLSGKVPEEMGELDPDGRAAAGGRLRSVAAMLFAGTQANWTSLFELACENDPKLAKWVLLKIVPFTQLTGQRLLRRDLARRAVVALRSGNHEPELAACLGTLGYGQSDLGEHEAAQESYHEALEIRRRLAAQHPAAFEPDVAMTLNNLGNVQRALGEREAARKSFHGALEIYRRLAAQHPAAFEPNVAMTLNNLGTVQSDLGEREAARECYAEALGIYAPLAEKYPRAFVHNLRIVLRGYTSVTPESEDDPWWRLWRELTRQPEDAPT
jgi:hypothetical protein